MSGVIMISSVQSAAAALFDVSVEDQKSPRKFKRMTDVRQAAMAAAYEVTGKSLPQIGRAFGGRDHTTVRHAVKVARERPCLSGMVSAIRSRLLDGEAC